MASPGNQHCANCIGTLSFPMCTVQTHDTSMTYLILIGSRHVRRRTVHEFQFVRCESLPLEHSSSEQFCQFSSVQVMCMKLKERR